jgi:AcrR family transcriptional regulator
MFFIVTSRSTVVHDHRNTPRNYVQDHILIDSAASPAAYSSHQEKISMPYPPGHRDQVKARIVSSARRLFNRHGFDNVSVQSIMSGAGLTHGGFYSYFQSKSDLYAEVLGCFFTDPEWKNAWEGVEVDLASAEAGPQVVRAYLSRQHYEDVENSCPMVALPGDVTRSGAQAKCAFEAIFKAMVGVLERSVLDRSVARESPVGNGRPQKAVTRHAVAQATAALCVGGMVVARAMENRALADELRDACMGVAFELGGWGNGSQSQNGKRSRAGLSRTARPRAKTAASR